MIDTHSHILPGVDDGAANLGESLAMARFAVAEGVRGMLTTSHSAEWLARGRLPRMEAEVAVVQTALDAAAIPLRLWPGLEIYLTPETPAHLAAGRLWSLAGSRYVLVEVDFQPWPPFAESVLFQLQVAGWWPILAHPERYIPIQHDPTIMLRLAERGILGQVTALSLTGGNGPAVRDCALTLLEYGLAQILASDGHGVGAGRRQPTIAAGLAVAAERLGTEAAHALVTTAPQHILDNTPLIPDPRPLPPKQSFFSRLRGK
jgi:protein-tyrosine phosphatase